jgi:hypothetical protein
MWQSFLSRCKELLKLGVDMRVKGNVVRCLKDLLAMIEGRKYLMGTEPSK